MPPDVTASWCAGYAVTEAETFCGAVDTPRTEPAECPPALTHWTEVSSSSGQSECSVGEQSLPHRLVTAEGKVGQTLPGVATVHAAG